MKCTDKHYFLLSFTELSKCDGSKDSGFRDHIGNKGQQIGTKGQTEIKTSHNDSKRKQ